MLLPFVEQRERFFFLQLFLCLTIHHHPSFHLYSFLLLHIISQDSRLLLLRMSVVPEENHHSEGGKMAEEGQKGRGSRRETEMASDHSRKDLQRPLCACISIFLLLAGITVLTLWLVYRPHNPQFAVVGAAVYDLNISSPPLLSAVMQFTIITRNPNSRVSIYYDRLTTFVSYRNQEITPQVKLPPLFHRTKSTVVMSPLIGGGLVPVSQEVADGLAADQAMGVVAFRVVVLGSLRWKAGAIKTARYGVYVECDVLVGSKNGFLGQVPLLHTPGCNVDI